MVVVVRCCDIIRPRVWKSLNALGDELLKWCMKPSISTGCPAGTGMLWAESVALALPVAYGRGLQLK